MVKSLVSREQYTKAGYWSVMACVAIYLFWLIYRFTVGSVPEVNRLSLLIIDINLPLAFSRWWDFLVGPFLVIFVMEIMMLVKSRKEDNLWVINKGFTLFLKIIGGVFICLGLIFGLPYLLFYYVFFGVLYFLFFSFLLIRNFVIKQKSKRQARAFCDSVTFEVVQHTSIEEWNANHKIFEENLEQLKNTPEDQKLAKAEELFSLQNLLQQRGPYVYIRLAAIVKLLPKPKQTELASQVLNMLSPECIRCDLIGEMMELATKSENNKWLNKTFHTLHIFNRAEAENMTAGLPESIKPVWTKKLTKK